MHGQELVCALVCFPKTEITQHKQANCRAPLRTGQAVSPTTRTRTPTLLAVESRSNHSIAFASVTTERSNVRSLFWHNKSSPGQDRLDLAPARSTFAAPQVRGLISPAHSTVPAHISGQQKTTLQEKRSAATTGSSSAAPSKPQEKMADGPLLGLGDANTYT